MYSWLYKPILLLLLVVVVVLILRWMNKSKLRSGGQENNEDTLQAVLLEDLTQSQQEQFIKMFTPENTAGLGKQWDEAKAAGLIRYAAIDAKTANRKNWHYALVDGDVVVGYIGIGPTGVKQYPGSQLTWMVPIANRGHGYTARGLKKIKRRALGKVYSFVALGNDASNAVAKQACTLIGQEMLFGSIHNVYIFQK